MKDTSHEPIPHHDFRSLRRLDRRVVRRRESTTLPWTWIPLAFVAVLPMYAQSPPLLPFTGEGVVATTIFRGQELTYTVTDGLAIHGGDIILGTAEEAAAAAPRATAVRGRASAQLGAAHEDDGLWPGGVIPYVIDEDVTNSEDVLRAIEEWNTKTVISLVERTTEEDYVRFRSAGGCRAQIGRVGGEQFIELNEYCDWRIVVHEIGHAVGLWHEHQRQDRDRYLMVFEDAVGLCSNPFALSPDAVVERPYDYASTMHYGRGPWAELPWLDTIPPGISIVSAFTPAPLSSGDIDYVARLYRQPPTATTISSNPPGLDIMVDGVRYGTPATFDWVPGSRHQIEAPLVQTGDNPVLGDCCNFVDYISFYYSGDYSEYESSSLHAAEERTRYVFGNWTDGGGRSHSVTAGPDTTWYQANYIVQLDMAHGAPFPREGGRMTIQPESPDGFYSLGALVKISAVPNPGFNFLYWQGDWMPGSGQISWIRGISWNPARLHVGLNGSVPNVSPVFTSSPVISFEATGHAYDAHFKVVDRGGRGRLYGGTFPTNFAVDEIRRDYVDNDGMFRITIVDGITFGVVEPIPRFLQWSDGVVGSSAGERDVVREMAVPDKAGKLVTEWETLVPLYDGTWCHACRVGVDRIDIHPPPPGYLKEGVQYGWSDTDYYPLGTRVELTAVPTNPDDEFVGWLRDAYGTNPVTSVVMDGPKEVGALFSDLPILQPGVPESGNLSRVRGYWIYVPFDAAELAVTVEMEKSAAHAVLAVSQGSETWIDDNGRIQGAEYQAQLSGGSARIAITRDSSPPIMAGPYFMRVVAADEAAATGTLTAELASGIPVKTSPRAFTFVTTDGFDPAPQTFEIRNLSDKPLSYLFESDRAWLRVEPQKGTLGAGETAELTAAVSGTGIPVDIHQGNLAIIDTDGTYERGISLPVTFALVPLRLPAVVVDLQ